MMPKCKKHGMKYATYGDCPKCKSAENTGVIGAELLPCPFCGKTKLEAQRGLGGRDGIPVNIVCCFCGASGPIYHYVGGFNLADTSAIAVKTGWNVIKRRRYE